MRYSLEREGDGAGDRGGMSDAITPIWDENQKMIDTIIEQNARPKVGAVMRVGSTYARSYYSQDWWMTTPITEILDEHTREDGAEYVRFKTRNSIYIWRCQ